MDYQLQKYYNFRVQELTHAEVEEMPKQVDVIVEEQILCKAERSKERLPFAVAADDPKQHRGKRDDHDQLPDEIKALFVENLSLLQRMRELHLKLRSLSLEDAPCPDSERYPFLKEIIALDKKLHSNWEQYDHFIPTDPTASADTTPTKAKPKSAPIVRSPQSEKNRRHKFHSKAVERNA